MATQQQQKLQETSKQFSKGATQALEGLNGAVRDFENLDGGEILSAAIAWFTPIREQTVKAARFTVDYGRRHPIRMAISVAAVGLLAARLLKPSKSLNA